MKMFPMSILASAALCLLVPQPASAMPRFCDDVCESPAATCLTLCAIPFQWEVTTCGEWTGTPCEEPVDSEPSDAMAVSEPGQRSDEASERVCREAPVTSPI